MLARARRACRDRGRESAATSGTRSASTTCRAARSARRVPRATASTCSWSRPASRAPRGDAAPRLPPRHRFDGEFSATGSRAGPRVRRANARDPHKCRKPCAFGPSLKSGAPLPRMECYEARPTRRAQGGDPQDERDLRTLRDQCRRAGVHRGRRAEDSSRRLERSARAKPRTADRFERTAATDVPLQPDLRAERQGRWRRRRRRQRLVARPHRDGIRNRRSREAPPVSLECDPPGQAAAQFVQLQPIELPQLTHL